MARQILAPQRADSDGMVPVYQAGHVDGHGLVPSTGAVVHLRNKSASVALTVTIPTPGTVDGLAIPERVINVPVSSEVFIGLGRAEAYRQSDTNMVHIDLSAVTSVDLALIQAP